MNEFSLLQIPGYAEAVFKERIIRDAAFLPLNEAIGPFEVVPMSLRHYLILRMSGNPLLGKATPTPEDLAAFLWILSTNFSLEKKAREKFYARCRREFFPLENFFIREKEKKARILSAANLIFAARSYVSETFQDSAPSAKTVQFDKEYFSDAAAICADFARDFGWDDEVTLDKPIKRLLQYLKAQRQHLDPKVILFNPSDAVLTRREAL